MGDTDVVTELSAAAAPLDDDALAERYAPPASPWLRVNFVTSLDGAAAVDGRSAPLSSAADRRLFRLLRMRCDALLVGAGTLRDEQYGPLRAHQWGRAWRRSRGLPEHPVLVVVSGTLDLDPSTPVFTEAPRRPVVLAPASAPAARRHALAGVAEVLTAGDQTVDLATALAELHRLGLSQILCEGGPHLLGRLTAADLVDELCLSVSPVLAGAGASRITSGPSGTDLSGPASALRRMSLHHVLAADGMLLLRYLRAR